MLCKYLEHANDLLVMAKQRVSGASLVPLGMLILAFLSTVLFSECQSEEASLESGWLSLKVGMFLCTCGVTSGACKHLISLLLLESD